MLPKFIVIGAMKAGTTSLFHYLSEHPQIFVHPQKELAYFVAPEQRRRVGSYEDFFESAPPHAFPGDISTQYTKFPQFPHVPGRIRQKVPDARLIYIVRDPIARTISHYHHNLLQGLESAPIEAALRADSRYLEFSRYRMQLSFYEQHFPREQILVVVLEELHAQPVATISAVFRHIGCDPSFVPANLHKKSNVSREQVRTTAAIRAIQDWPLYRTVQYRIPARLKRQVVRWLGGAPPALPAPTPATRAWIRDQHAHDAASLAEWLERPEPIWDLNEG